MKEQNLKTREEKLTDEEAKTIDNFNVQAKSIMLRIGEVTVQKENELADLKRELNKVNAGLGEYTQGLVKKHKFKNVLEFRKKDNTIIGI